MQIMIKLKVFLIVCRQIPRARRSIAFSHTHTHTHTHTLLSLSFLLLLRSPLLHQFISVHVYMSVATERRESSASRLIGLTHLAGMCALRLIKQEHWSILDGLAAVIYDMKKKKNLLHWPFVSVCTHSSQ